MFSTRITALILDNPLPDETPGARLKQVGLMALIYRMQLEGTETLVANIAEISGLSRQAVTILAEPLVQRNLLVEKQVLNSIGRGRAHMLVIPDAVFSLVQPA